jgi:hypothetical protein
MAMYFTIEEMTNSLIAKQNGINNTPDEYAKKNIEYLMDNCLDKIRKMWGKPIYINSGYRSIELNSAVGGAGDSQHLKGEAADITTGCTANNKILFEMICASDIEFDQLINENRYEWLHISCKNKNIGNRLQVLHL